MWLVRLAGGLIVVGGGIALAGLSWAWLDETTDGLGPGLTVVTGLVIASWSVVFVVAAAARALWTRSKRTNA